MPKAHIKRPDGTSILIEGTAQEVAELMGKLEGDPAFTSTPASANKPRRKARTSGGKSSLPDILLSLKQGGFFKKPKDLAEVKQGLAEMGEVYGTTTVAPALLRLVQGRHLRRIKQDKRWFYTG